MPSGRHGAPEQDAPAREASLPAEMAHDRERDGGLATTRLADEPVGLPRRDGEAHPGQHLDRAPPLAEAHRDVVEGEGRRMTEVAVSSNAAIVAPCWSADGKRLALFRCTQMILYPRV